MSMNRKGDWMQTYSGIQYWPLDPDPKEVNIEDIAHALSLSCRYNGHCLRFYSVAEHSVHLSQYVTEDAALWALLHDASEAYITDIIRPIKPHLTNYYTLEDLNMKAICERFGLPELMPSEVKDADNRILLDELNQNMTKPPAPWNIPGTPLGVDLNFWSPETAELMFLNRFHELYED